MKTIEAPNKIYLSPAGVLYKGDKQQESDIEYIRTDAFIEKAARFLEYHLHYRVEITQPGTILETVTTREDFIEQFIKAMKGE